ncbi:hypothetical protein C8T65DRAFT_745745 [Cerioporus squamosus]|nr:hypothetical protein C8T65DRAFT_745745 [Cerioporus squamosus]
MASLPSFGLNYALRQTQDKEDGILTIEARAEKDLVDVLMKLSLAGAQETWLENFAARSSAMNKEHRHNVKQSMNNAGLLISFLYGNVIVAKFRGIAKSFKGRENALRELNISVSRMSQSCQTASRLYTMIEDKYARQGELSSALRQRLPIVRRSLDNVKGSIQYLGKEEAAIVALFQEWEPVFAVKYYTEALNAIHAHKIDQSDFVELAAPIFSVLLSACEERKQIVEDIKKIATKQTTNWMTRPLDIVLQSELDVAMGEYNGYAERIIAVREEQAKALTSLKELENIARNSPPCLYGPRDVVVPISDMQSVFRKFETLRFRAIHLDKLATKVVGDLKAVRM